MVGFGDETNADVLLFISEHVLSSCVFSNVYSLRSQLFLWKQLENLYFREKKFAVEVNDPHRSETTSPI